jgi:hypothetical protein
LRWRNHSFQLYSVRANFFAARHFPDRSLKMRKFLVCIVAVMLFSAVALAAPKAEIFGGYQYTHFDGGPNASGRNAALTGNFNSWV